MSSDSDNEIYVDDEKTYTIKKNKDNHNILSKYEKTKILSDRANQIANGSPIFVKGEFTNEYEIAEEEFRQNKIPFIIKRRNGQYIELLKLCDFELSQKKI
jgi:DNA-directed RNA polymerase subunit K/omega